VGFAGRVLFNEPLSEEQICDELERRYTLKIDQEISDVLQDLVNMRKAEKKGNMYIKAPAQIG
jgi:hypothetical protein